MTLILLYIYILKSRLIDLAQNYIIYVGRNYIGTCIGTYIDFKHNIRPRLYCV